MVFDGKSAGAEEAAGDTSTNRFSETEVETSFSRVTCYECRHTAVYKYRVKKLRRRPEIVTADDEQVRADHLEIWEGVPRFAEIPETVRCRNCGEVLGLYTECIF